MSAERDPNPRDWLHVGDDPFDTTKMSPGAQAIYDQIMDAVNGANESKDQPTMFQMIREELGEFRSTFRTALAKEYPWDEDEVEVKMVTMIFAQIFAYYWYKKRLGAPRWAARGLTGIGASVWMLNERLRHLRKLIEAQNATDDESA